MKPQQPSSENILSFTGIRAIACTLVILAHCTNQGFGWEETVSNAGTPSVYLFFVLSGYLLMKRGLQDIQPSLDAVPQRFVGMRLVKYLIRRFMRVYPAYLVMIPLYKIMTWYASDIKARDYNVNEYDRSIWKSLYFQGMGGIIWTLRVEIEFFLTFLPVILVLAAEFKILDYLYFRNSQFKPSHFFYLITTLILAYIQYRWGNESRGGVEQGGQFSVHLPAFWHGCLAGIASYHLNLHKVKISIDTPLRRLIVELLSWGLILRLALGNKSIIASHLGGDWKSWYHNPFLQSPFKAALLLIMEFTHETNSISRTLSLPLFQYIGKISYSTYLIHMWVLCIFKMNTNIRGVAGNFEVMILSFFAGSILYHYVEAKGVKYGENLIKMLQGSSQIYVEEAKKWLVKNLLSPPPNEIVKELPPSVPTEIEAVTLKID